MPLETYPLLYDGVTESLIKTGRVRTAEIAQPYAFRVDLYEGCHFQQNKPLLWKDDFNEQSAAWLSSDVARGLELINYVRNRIIKINK